MATLMGRVIDARNGSLLEARVHVLASTGAFVSPASSVLKVGGGLPFFYTDGEFAVDLPRGQADVVIERGTEYQPLRTTVRMPSAGLVTIDLPLQRWVNLPEQGWYAGNTHIHYDEHETRPDERLRLDPRVEDLTVAVVSILKRRELAYASNKYPIGLMRRHEEYGHVLDIGEETRHNTDTWETGLGHLMLINLRELVEPVSRGLLVDESDPDYPPLVDACDKARRQGGLTIWCHNGNGMEAPVAAALGKLDAFNLFDPYWMDPEYDVWYRLLNCGIRLPASTGSDWFICSSNRVYVDLGQPFTYPNWLEALKTGRTFITDGPALFLRVEDSGPGDTVDLRGVALRRVQAVASWRSYQPVNRVEILKDGLVVGGGQWAEGRSSGELSVRVAVEEDCWLAARCWGDDRTSYGHFLWAHTSPVYVRTGLSSAAAPESASFFLERIEESLQWVRRKARVREESQRKRLVELFQLGREYYTSLLHPAR